MSISEFCSDFQDGTQTHSQLSTTMNRFLPLWKNSLNSLSLLSSLSWMIHRSNCFFSKAHFLFSDFTPNSSDAIKPLSSSYYVFPKKWEVETLSEESFLAPISMSIGTISILTTHDFEWLVTSFLKLFCDFRHSCFTKTLIMVSKAITFMGFLKLLQLFPMSFIQVFKHLGSLTHRHLFHRFIYWYCSHFCQ